MSQVEIYSRIPINQAIAITSGKGGVGKTNIAANLAYLINQTGRKVMLVDADIHLGNVDLVLGLPIKANLADAFREERDFSKVLYKVARGIHILPASSALAELVNQEDKLIARLFDYFKTLQTGYDAILFDTASGIGKNVLSFVLNSRKVVVVVTPDPASIADAYGMMKMIITQRPGLPILLVPNLVSSEEEGRNLYSKLNLMTQRFLGTDLYYAASIPIDENVQEAVRSQQPFVQMFPLCSATYALKRVLAKLYRLPDYMPPEKRRSSDMIKSLGHFFVGGEA